MAIVGANKISADASTDATSYAVATFAASTTSSAILIAYVANTKAALPDTPTISSAHGTWTQIATIAEVVSASQLRITAFRCVPVDTSTHIPTIDFAGVTQTGCAWSFVEFTGVDASGSNGANAIVQSGTSATDVVSGTVTAWNVTLGTAITAGNATTGAASHTANQTTLPGSGYTELGDVNHGSPANGMESEWRADGNTVVNWTWATLSDAAAVAMELAQVVGWGALLSDSRNRLVYA